MLHRKMRGAGDVGPTAVMTEAATWAEGVAMGRKRVCVGTVACWARAACTARQRVPSHERVVAKEEAGGGGGGVGGRILARMRGMGGGAKMGAQATDGSGRNDGRVTFDSSTGHAVGSTHGGRRMWKWKERR